MKYNTTQFPSCPKEPSLFYHSLIGGKMEQNKIQTKQNTKEILAVYYLSQRENSACEKYNVLTERTLESPVPS